MPNLPQATASEFQDPAWLGRGKPRVAVLAPPDKPHVQTELERLLPVIAAHAEITHVDQQFQYDFQGGNEDLVVVLGGDGSILQAARQMGYHQKPVLGVNLGRLGFLAALHPDHFLEVWPQVASGACKISQNLMLQCRIIRGEEEVCCQIGLNEVALRTGAPFTMVQLDLYVDAILATTYSCDGLIISTPVGSTAHNLSAGGPILLKGLQAFVISPISPHTLTMRPVVDSADRVFDLRLRLAQSGVSVVVDGRVLGELHADDFVRIERAPACFQLVKVPGQNTYRTLREKLGWGGTPQGAVK